MFMLTIQILLLLAIAFILGCILGCVLRRLFGTAEVAAPVAAAVVAAPAVAAPRKKSAPVPAAAPRKPAVRKKAKRRPAVKAKKDDLKKIKGIGQQNEARLNAIGVSAFSQIAAWSAKAQRDIGDRLAFPGRIEREDWVKQAKILAKGGQTGFSRRVIKGEVSSSSGKGSVSELGTKPRMLSKPRVGGSDNLTLIDGVGNALEKKLFALGIYHFDQIAAWSKDHSTWIGNELGFPGRPQRENWVGDSKVLAKGGMTRHARRVERGEIGTSRKSRK